MDEKIIPNMLSGLLENSKTTKESAAKILAAASEYIDYKEHIAGRRSYVHVL